jgi:hypothetical protein
MMLVTSVGLARPSSVRIGLEATGSFTPRRAELNAAPRPEMGDRRETDQSIRGDQVFIHNSFHLFVQL